MKYLGKITDNKDLITKEYLNKERENLVALLPNYVSSNIDIQLGINGILCDKEELDGGDQYKYIIPIASDSSIGIVKGSPSEAANGILVNSDGTMSVNKIEISKIFVPEETSLIFDGGTSTI